jgi:hypothetical protein
MGFEHRRSTDGRIHVYKKAGQDGCRYGLCFDTSVNKWREDYTELVINYMVAMEALAACDKDFGTGGVHRDTVRLISCEGLVSVEVGVIDRLLHQLKEQSQMK